jgi:hypothetical protein
MTAADLPTIIGIIEILILLGGFWGVVHVLRTRLKALNGRVEALEGTVKAQQAALQTQTGILGDFGSLVKAMQAIVDAADPREMAERMKAYKELVEHHFRELLERERRQLGAEREAVRQEVRTWMLATVDALYKLAPYVPPQDRPKIVDRLRVPPEHKAEIGQIVFEAPDLSLRLFPAFAKDTVLLVDTAKVELSPPPPTGEATEGGASPPGGHQ